MFSFQPVVAESSLTHRNSTLISFDLALFLRMMVSKPDDLSKVTVTYIALALPILACCCSSKGLGI
jgi:hypothetical protein